MALGLSAAGEGRSCFLFRGRAEACQIGIRIGRIGLQEEECEGEAGGSEQQDGQEAPTAAHTQTLPAYVVWLVNRGGRADMVSGARVSGRETRST